MNRTSLVIKELRTKHNLTQEELGAKLGVKKSAINKYENGSVENLKRSTIQKLSEIFNVSPIYIMGLEDTSIDWLSENGTPAGEFNLLPIYGVVYAGNGMLEEDILGYEIADHQYTSEEHFYLQVKGDSMQPHINEGDLVLVRKQTSVDSGDVGIFAVDEEEGVVKKVIYDKAFIELHSFNPYYPVRRFADEDVLLVRVIGKVIESKRKW